MRRTINCKQDSILGWTFERWRSEDNGGCSSFVFKKVYRVIKKVDHDNVEDMFDRR